MHLKKPLHKIPQKYQNPIGKNDDGLGKKLINNSLNIQ